MPTDRYTRGERLRRFENHGPGHLRQIKYLSDKHQEIIRLKKLGMRNIDIARELDVSKNWIKIVRASDVGQEEANRIDAIRDDVVLDIAAKLQRGSGMAVDYLLAAMDVNTDTGKKFDNAPPLKLKAAVELMDRTPDTAKISRHETKSTVTHATLADLIRIKEIARRNQQAQIERNKPIDVTPEV